MTATVKQIRKHFSAARTMKHNSRIGLYQGRNRGGDHTHHETAALKLMADLPRKLQGDLWAEYQIGDRLNQNHEAGVARPELSLRLRNTQRAIREVC